MRSNLLCILILTILIFSSCAEEADIPVFVTVHPPNFSINSNQGSAFQDISKYFMFHRTSLLGGFSYDNEIPVLASGNEALLIFPGIRKNGLVEQPAIYQMMSSDTIQRNFSPGDLIEFTPTFRYLNNVNFRILENFENGTGFSEDADGNVNTEFRLESGIGYNSSTGGVMEVTIDDPLLEIAWQPSMSNFPITGDVIVELTHKNNIELGVGILAKSALIGTEKIYKVILFPSVDWNKVYVDIGPEIRTSGADEIQLLLGAIHSNSDTLAIGRAIIDDIKLLYLE